MNPFMPPNTRQRLIARMAALACGAALPPLGNRPEPSGDKALLGICIQFGDLERRKMLLYDGPDRILDDDLREEELTPLIARQIELLEALCDLPVIGLAGLRAKAIVWTLWDCGEVFQRAARYELVEDRLLVSLLRDLGAT